MQRSMDKDQCDPEADSEDEELPGIENQWCLSLDLSYHYFVGPQLLGFMAKTDAACVSVTCQFAILIAPKERESITKYVW